ncbi:testis-expressed protein 10-like isoform X1 [Stylophora pistillata]|uniref:testis-expressed protein 10-like isoform X1 n=1 Tax=Stylophora pistillata TaxID=50429 RepID=UPI000C03EAD5|nr:testis-expressed protein 10-like isoform X1 [Stylophora pistillata]
MAKNKRKRKLKEQDFQKVKFKVGKKLKPADNATDSSFKSRAIFIPTQLHTLDNVPTNQRNQTLKDLLAQVGHYSVNTRQEALGGLKDLLHHHENLLQENLGIVIKKVCEKMSDSDPSVRQSLLLLLCFIFPLVSQEKMAPFSALVIAHLSCAMTHIYDDIQHDSLGFLELCLRYFPSLMVGSSSQLIQNFVSMISHQNISGTKQSNRLQHKAGKGLAVNPKGKLSSLRSRLKVLQQLLALLKALESSSSSSREDTPLSSASLVKLPCKKQIIYFDKKKPTQIQVLEHSVQEPTLHPFSFDNSSAATALNTESKNNILTDGQMVKDFMEVIVPLLLECWIECSPAQMTTGLPNSMVSSSSINVMLAVTEILKIVLKAAQEKQTNAEVSEMHKPGDNLLDVYFKDVNQHLMSFFPFSVSDAPMLKRGRRKLEKVSQQAAGENSSASVLTLNLKICEVMMLFVMNGPAVQKNYHAIVHRLEEFVIESLELKVSGGAAGQQFQTDHVESLVAFADQILQYHNSCMKVGIPSKPGELLNATFSLYQSSHIKSGIKRVLITFFASLVFQENMSKLFELHKPVEKWLLGLPGLLVQLKDTTPGLTELVLRVMKKAVVQGILQSDDKVLAQLASFFSKDRGSFSKLSDEIQRLAVELLFHLPSLDDRLLANIVSCCHGGQVGVAIIQYLLQVLLYRSPSYEGAVSHPAAFTFEVYLSVLLGIAIGYSKDQLSDYQDVNKQAETCKVTDFIGCNFSILEENKGKEIDEANMWQSQQRKLQGVFQCFRQCPFNILLPLMSQELEQLLIDYKVLPLSAVHSILCVVRCVVQLTSDTGSTDRNCLFPTFLFQALTQLTLVGLKHSTSKSFSISEQKLRSEDLFVEAVELLCAVPQMMLEILSHLLAVLSDNSESVRETCTGIFTKLFSCKVRKLLLQSPDPVHLLVQRVLNTDISSAFRKQWFADLQYQYSLFKAEAGQTR